MRVRGAQRTAGLVSTLITASVLVVMFGAPALGQDEDDPGDVIDATVYLGPEDVVGVSCLPAIVTDNQPVTCVVDLTPDGPHLAVPSLDGPAIVAADSGREAQSKECFTDGPSRLICTELTPDKQLCSIR